ncbi:MAG: DUF4349 domain-containing protein [Deltaproteobacteria bacterium]|nr:DUF4349 domain-containing protein [Deltaproteobacteria bacterium]
MPRTSLSRASVALIALYALQGCASAGGYARQAMSPASATAGYGGEQGPMAAGDEAPPAPPAQPSAPGATPVQTAQTAVGSATGSAPTGPGSHVPGTPQGPDGATPPAANTPAPMLIYTAEVEMQVPAAEMPATLDHVIETAVALGGYLARRTDTSVQVRVPSARFREGLGRVERLGEVLHRNVSADDVSEEYRDLEVRLQNLRAVRRRLEEFLTRAGTMQEALTVERELERVTREIDQLEGRLRFLGARVAFSLVTVNLHPRPLVALPPPLPPPLVPPRRLPSLPVDWLQELGLDRLLNIRG